MACSYNAALCKFSLGHKFFGVFFLHRAAHGKTAKNMTKNLCRRDESVGVGIKLLLPSHCLDNL